MGRELPDGFFVYDPASENVHVLNAPMRFIWETCDGTKTVAEIVAEVSEAAQLSVEDAAKDVYHILLSLSANGLIHRI